ncbi:MAG: hypothetical protein QOG48_886, partial [Verrucomicrobiota bacterium]
ANALLCVICTILIVSAIGANVLLNCVTRFNAASSQVRGWKESLYAAEAGGDIAYAEVRKTILDPTHAFAGWTYTGGVRSNSPVTFGVNNLTAASAVDTFWVDGNGSPWYRIRANGTAPVLGFKRVGMDDRMGVGTRGDSLLRKIDLHYDHFIATYGPKGDGVGKAQVAVPHPQVTRRIELVASPVTPFEAAVKAMASFSGPGSAGVIDSYNSKNGPYYFAANNPSDAHYSDSHSGGVMVDTAEFSMNQGPIYGSVTTNGGTVKPSSLIYGTIDNNVPFTLPPFKMPTNLPAPQPSPTNITNNTTITPPAAGTASNPTTYLFSSITDDLTINKFSTAETYVAIHVTGVIGNNNKGSITVKSGVHAKIYFDGNIELKARDIDNQAGLAANLQFYGISPSDPSVVQRIDINPPGTFAATFYAPSADYHMNGNPDLLGAIVAKTYYGNGNTSVHYDRALDTNGDIVDYRIASYVEDTR